MFFYYALKLYEKTKNKIEKKIDLNKEENLKKYFNIIFDE